MRCATVVLTALASESFQAHFTNQEGGWGRDGPSLVTEVTGQFPKGAAPPPRPRHGPAAGSWNCRTAGFPARDTISHWTHIGSSNIKSNSSKSAAREPHPWHPSGHPEAQFEIRGPAHTGKLRHREGRVSPSQARAQNGTQVSPPGEMVTTSDHTHHCGLQSTSDCNSQTPNQAPPTNTALSGDSRLGSFTPNPPREGLEPGISCLRRWDCQALQPPGGNSSPAVRAAAGTGRASAGLRRGDGSPTRSPDCGNVH